MSNDHTVRGASRDIALPATLILRNGAQVTWRLPLPDSSHGVVRDPELGVTLVYELVTAFGTVQRHFTAYMDRELPDIARSFQKNADRERDIADALARLVSEITHFGDEDARQC